MYRNNSSRIFVKTVCMAIGLIASHMAIAQSRITEAIRSTERIAVKDSSPNRLIGLSQETGRLPASQKLGRMVLLLTPTAAQDQAAAALVAAQHDASSPLFHKWLTPAEFGQQFGIADADSSQVSQWLVSQGLTVHQVSQSRRFIVFSGNVAQVESAFSTQMHSYSYKNKPFIANSTDIQLPSALRNVVKGVVRLHSSPSSTTAVAGKKIHFTKSGGQFTFDVGSQGLAPADFAKIYNIQPLYNAGINGTGQSIAIVGRSNITIQDVRDFRNILGLPVNDPQIIINGDDPGITTDVDEATLDVTWSGAVAPMAKIQFVVSESNFADGVDVSAVYIVDNNLAPVMSTSYGTCESDLGQVENAFYNSLWQQAAAEGITSFVSAGDNGGAGCDSPAGGVYSSGVLAVNGLASTPYNVAVGGTEFDDTANPDKYWSATNNPTTGESALSYIPETAWNESSNDPNDVLLYAGSGGVSSIYPKPNWQTGVGVPNDGARDLPDISLTAALHDGYLLCMDGNCGYGDYFDTFGGTSASSPAAAGIMALVNQKMGGEPQGMANYVFYRLAKIAGVFHDTVKGNNKVPDPNGQYTVGYNTGKGYDLATGLGSMDVNALVNNWKSASTGTGSSVTLELGNGQSATVVHGKPISFLATVACSAPGTGTCTAATGAVALSASSSTAGTIGVGSSELTPLTDLSVANIISSVVPGGSYNVSARYSGDAKYSPATSNAIPVTVSAEKSQTVVGSVGGGTFATGPITVSYGESWPVAVVVAGNSGYGYPTGQITMTADGTPITNGGVYNYASGTFAPSTMTLNFGENNEAANLPNSQASTISYVLPTQALGAGSHRLVASYPGDPSFGPSKGAYTYTVSQAQGVIEDFFPIGDTVANAPVQLAAQVGFASLGFAPYGGTITVSDITTGSPVVLGKGKVDSSLYGGYWTATVNVPTPGTHTLRLDYTGDANVKGVSQTYYVPFTATDYSYVSLSSSVANSFGGQPVTLTATVGSGIPLHVATGTMTFFNGTTAIGGVKVPKSGNVVFTTSKLAAGTDNLTASYSGDAILTPSVSSPIQVTVSDYILQVLPASVTVDQGQSESVTLDLIPVGGFANPVQLACSNLPEDVTCKFSKSTVTLTGVNPVTVTLTLKATKSAEVTTKSVAVTITATSVAGTTPKTSTLHLTIKK
jgi:Pro-kumamolisin, activation domain/Bacterial Ig-like domain (group 3)